MHSQIIIHAVVIVYVLGLVFLLTDKERAKRPVLKITLNTSAKDASLALSRASGERSPLGVRWRSNLPWPGFRQARPASYDHLVSTEGSTLRYHAFISYSRAAAGRLAPALQSAVQRFAKAR